LSRKGLDLEVVEGLRKSFKVLRPVYPIVRSKRTGEIIDGFHRYEASPTTYKKYCVELDMDEKQEILYRLHLNYRRKVSKKERQQQLVKLAEILEKEGVTREEMVSELAKITPFTERWVRELLPEKYKMVERAPKEAEVLPHIERPKVETRVYKPKETWEYRKARVASPVSKMDEAVLLALSQRGVHPESQKAVCIKFVRPDLWFELPDRPLAVFLDGPVHVGREDRDEALRELLTRRGVDVLEIHYEQPTEREIGAVVEKVMSALAERGLKW